MQENSDNPIRVARLARGLSLRAFASKAGVHVQAVYLNECGCYPAVLPRILDYLCDALHQDRAQVQREYSGFVARKRVRFADDHALDQYSLSRLGEPGQHPFVAFRGSLKLSRMGFAKGACVQPAMLYNVENCHHRKLPEELIGALQGSRLPRPVILELATRYEEWCFD